MVIGKKTPPSPPSGGQPPKNGDPAPWANWPDAISCNIACGELIANLPQTFTMDGRIHAETLIAAAGALAGWGAQQSLLTRDDVAGLQAATVTDGRRFLLGDALNEMLFSNDPKIAPSRVINILLGGAVQHGAARDALPDIGGMFGYVARNLGGEREGWPSTPDTHRPAMAANKLLAHALPLLKTVMTREHPHRPPPEQQLRKSSWAAITARAAGGIMNQVCTVSPPIIAATIGCESAIYASKLIGPAS